MASDAYISEGQGNKSGSKIQQYSSLIGIVTAIVGNILISFALNIQRYAHIRLGREQEEENRSWNRRKRKSNNYASGHAEDGAPTRGTILGSDYRLDHRESDDETDETRPLIRSWRSGDSSGSESMFHASSNAEKQPHSAARKPYLKSPYWWAGILLMTTGEAGNFLAYGFAPASIVSPLGVVALVSNCVIAPFMLKERFRLRDFGGVVVAVAGAVVVVLSAKSSERKLGQSEIWDAITRWEFEVYLGVTVAAIIALMWASGRYGERSILIDLGLVGLFGGYTALSTKGIASLLSYTFWHVVTFPITYLLLVILVVTAFMQIRYVNRALQRFDSTVVIPTQFVLFTISVIMGSAILYRDFEQATAEQTVKFVGGCLLTFLGVYLITSGRAEQTDDEEAEEDDEEETVRLVDNGHSHQNGIEDSNTLETRQQSQASTSRQRPDHRASSSKHSSFPDLDGTVSSPHRSPSSNSPTRAHHSRSLSTHSAEPSISPSMAPNQQTSNPPSDHQHPGLQATVSSPLLPSSAQDPSPDRPSTPRARSHANNPDAPKGQLRPSTLSRKSMQRILPGPLLSPLSSPLSAVVADSLRRGVDTSPLRRRMGSSLRGRDWSGGANPGQSARFSDAGLEGSHTSPLKVSSTEGGHEEAERADSDNLQGKRRFSVGAFFGRKE